jgi:hypothetical protein
MGNKFKRYMIACIHATPLAIGPVSHAFHVLVPNWEFRDIIEERLFDLQGKGEEAFKIFFKILKQAESSECDAILTTCSLYTQYLPEIRRNMLKPTLGIDEPMIEKAVTIGGNIALVGSLPSAIETTANLIQKYAALHKKRVDLSNRVIVEANICSTQEGLKRFADQLRQLKRIAEGIVIVQASLSGVSELLSSEENERILTSPRLAIAKLHSILEGKSLKEHDI